MLSGQNFTYLKSVRPRFEWLVIKVDLGDPMLGRRPLRLGKARWFHIELL